MDTRLCPHRGYLWLAPIPVQVQWWLRKPPIIVAAQNSIVKECSIVGSASTLLTCGAIYQNTDMIWVIIVVFNTDIKSRKHEIDQEWVWFASMRQMNATASTTKCYKWDRGFQMFGHYCISVYLVGFENRYIHDLAPLNLFHFQNSDIHRIIFIARIWEILSLSSTKSRGWR